MSDPRPLPPPLPGSQRCQGAMNVPNTCMRNPLGAETLKPPPSSGGGGRPAPSPLSGRPWRSPSHGIPHPFTTHVSPSAVGPSVPGFFVRFITPVSFPGWTSGFFGWMDQKFGTILIFPTSLPFLGSARNPPPGRGGYLDPWVGGSRPDLPGSQKRNLNHPPREGMGV